MEEMIYGYFKRKVGALVKYHRFETKLKASERRKRDKKGTKVFIPRRESYFVACIRDFERVTRVFFSFYGCSKINIRRGRQRRDDKRDKIGRGGEIERE